MVVTSKLSRRSSVRQPQEGRSTTISKNTRAKQRGLADHDEHSDHDKDILSLPTRPKSLTASKSLPVLRRDTVRKRPHVSSPPAASPTRTTRRPRAPLDPAPQQTTLEGYLTANKEDQNESRPAKKARRDDTVRRAVPVVAATSTRAPLHSRDSPDPLNTISSPDHPPSRTRQRANTLSLAPPPISSPSSRRLTRHGGQNPPVIIASDVTFNAVEPRETRQDNSRSMLTAEAGHKQNNAWSAPEKRSLRSHDGGSRSKSELGMYFPNYEQMISLEPVKLEFLAPETTVIIIDDLGESPLPPSPVSSPSRTRKRKSGNPEQISPFGNPLLNLHECETIELPKGEDTGDMDPLREEVYFKAHRRHERQEKQLRNIEKERAQHEKTQLDRLLDELQGHDWLRVMGISGITDTEKKLYEPKRDLFVREVAALIEKFRVWKEEEKRRKLERDQMLREAALSTEPESEPAVEVEDSEAEEEEEDVDDEEEAVEEVTEEAQPPPSDNQSYGDPPDPGDLDAWAARQLIQEARSASGPKRTRLVDGLSGTPPPHTPPRPEKPFESFYSKRHLRDAAIAGHRRGRFRTAFGQPVPELEERDFDLPDDILTPDVLQSLDRKRRRLKRESKG